MSIRFVIMTGVVIAVSASLFVSMMSTQKMILDVYETRHDITKKNESSHGGSTFSSSDTNTKDRETLARERQLHENGTTTNSSEIGKDVNNASNSTAEVEEYDDETDDGDDGDDYDVAEIDWGNFSYSQFWYGLGCHRLTKSPRPILCLEILAYLRSVYVDTVGVEKSSIVASTINGTGLQKNITAKHSEGKGRGIFANEFIAKGELVWSSSHTARFDSGELYRQFLRSLPVDLACDVLTWSYVQNMTSTIADERELLPYYGSNGSLRLSVDLDHGALMNNANDDDNYSVGEANIGCLEDAERLSGLGLSCSQNFFAIRDIQEGDELICSYGEFALESGWEAFGV